MKADYQKPPKSEIKQDTKLRFKNHEQSAENLNLRSHAALDYAADSIKYLFAKSPLSKK